MPKRDFYEVLGVSKDADEKAIKSAYRKLAMANHPDRNAGDEAAAERFKEASEAYEVLKDSQKRAAYDQMGHAAFEQGGGFGGGGFGGAGFGGGGFSDIFEQMFSEFSGGRGRAEQARHGADLRYDLTIDLDEAYTGCQKDIVANISSTCDSCGGIGAAKGSQPVPCSGCGGMGKVRAQQGFFTVERTCPACQGAGETISNPCSPCRGQGRVEKSENLSVNIPAGVDTGTRIRLSGKGEAGLRGAPSGDLYIFVNVSDHPIFERDGGNLYIDVPVPMVTAALGGTIDVPTLGGKMTRLQIEKGTQSGRKFRMRGKGMPGLRGGNHGDQIVEIIVETPTKLSKKQINLLQEFDEAGDASPQTKGFIDRVKTLWS
ncbi:MAG: molecular chaperone DnaJ [Candidatus Puniceispirillaceae bacterium]